MYHAKIPGASWLIAAYPYAVGSLHRRGHVPVSSASAEAQHLDNGIPCRTILVPLRFWIPNRAHNMALGLWNWLSVLTHRAHSHYIFYA